MNQEVVLLVQIHGFASSFTKMVKKDNKDDMAQKDSSDDSETSSKSPDLRAFFNLVDRAHSLQLLKEKNQGLENQGRINFNAWQPSFEPEDFNLPPKRGFTSTMDRPRTRAAVGEGGGSGGSGGGGDEGKEEKRLKRPRHFVDLALQCVPEEGLKKGDTCKVLLCDLNKEAESSEAVNGGFAGLNLELGIRNS